MKTIRQLSEELKISKEAIYKKVKYQLKNELEGHVVKVDNVTQIDEFGERILFESLSLERQQSIQSTIDAEIYIEESEETVCNLEPVAESYQVEFIKLLQEQLRLKDRQINIQNEHISQLITQTGYGQLLLKTSIYKNTLLLQASEGTRKLRSKPFWMKLLRK